jgi:hypothetical protein
MILRRIIAHFRKQEWTAIDFVIVVMGAHPFLTCYPHESRLCT